jgi:hypothetical protein
MMALPQALPRTTPVVLTDAINTALLLQLPPLTALESNVLLPRHTARAPVITPALAKGFTVINVV